MGYDHVFELFLERRDSILQILTRTHNTDTCFAGMFSDLLKRAYGNLHFTVLLRLSFCTYGVNHGAYALACLFCTPQCH